MAKKKTLKTFLVTYHSPASAMNKMKKAKREEMAAAMKAWMKWSKKCGKKLIEMGAPLKPGSNKKAKGGWSKSKRKLSGYSILQAENLTGARNLLKDHPHLAWAAGCEIEIHEMTPMG